MKKRTIALILILATFVCIFAFAACDKTGNGKDLPSGETPSGSIQSGNDNKPSGSSNISNATLGGTYYYCENNTLDDFVYFQFTGGNWTDDEGNKGTYTISGKTVTLYLEKIEFVSGNINGDDVTLTVFGEKLLYRKGPDLTSLPKSLSFKLSEDKKYYIVTGIGGLSGDIVIPDTFKRKPVKEIEESAFERRTALTSIVLPDTIEAIGEKAFYKCTKLTRATLAGKITEIPVNAFAGCEKLTEVTIPKSVKLIDADAFYECRGLQDVKFLGSASDWCSITFCDAYDNGQHIGMNLPNDEYYYSNPLNNYSSMRDEINLIIDGKVATEITVSSAEVSSYAFIHYQKLTSVKFTSNVKKIGEYAFNGCFNLKSVDMSESGVSAIERYAFELDYNITSVKFSSSLKTIGNSAFERCDKLPSLSFGDSLISIGDNAFDYCDKVTSIDLGNSVGEIGVDAFSGCEITEITIPASTWYIGNYAFCTSTLKKATFEKTSGWYLLTGQGNKEVQDLSNTATAAKYLSSTQSAEWGEEGYSDYIWQRQILSFGYKSDNTCCVSGIDKTVNVTSLTIPSSVIYNGKAYTVTEILYRAFSGCSSLTSIEIPSSVTCIGGSAFSGCSSLEEVYYKGDLASWCEISYYSASNCNVFYANPMSYASKLYINGELLSGEITIPSTVTYIGSWAFSYCSSLTSIVIPSSVTSIGEHAFYGCSSLTRIEIPGSVTYIDEYAFRGCDSLTIYCEVSSKPSGWDSDWNMEDSFYRSRVPVVWGLNNITTNSEYDYVVHNDKVYLTKYKGTSTNVTIPSTIDGKEVVSIGAIFEGNTTIQSVVIPSSVTSIGRWAFYNCSTLTSVTFGENSKLESIGSYAFRDCSSLTSIEIPSSVTTIYSSAFSGCSSLTRIEIPSSVTSIGDSAFWNCSSLTIVTFRANSQLERIGGGLFYNCPIEEATIPTIAIGCIPKSNLKKVVITSGTSIGDSAFWNCSSLTSIVIPSSVTSIGYHAFYKCTSLTSVTFKNTSGWYRTSSETATSGTSISVTNSSTNATNLRSTYASYYWKRNA